jgi:hypothetical protein
MQILGSFDIPNLHLEMACIEGLDRCGLVWWD